MAFGVGCANRPLKLPEELSPAPPCASQGQAACEAACDANDGSACLAASIAYGPKSKTPDAARMEAYELKACDLGVAVGCRYYANNFGDDPQKARTYFLKGCEGGDWTACKSAINKGLRVEDSGDFVSPEATRRAAQMACDREWVNGCLVLADLQALGIGGTRDVEAARKLYAAACKPKNPSSCENATTLESEIDIHRLTFNLLERLHYADPDFAVAGAGSNWKAKVAVRACFDKADSNPKRIAIVESSGNPDIDEIVEHSTQRWRFRARPSVPDGVSLCIRMHYEMFGA